MSGNLVVVRCGRRSLHRAWLRRGARRRFDVWLAPFEEIPPSDEAPAFARAIPGPKWSGLARLLADEPSWRRYDRVWLPDDDVEADAATVERLFDESEALSAAIAAPALAPDSQYSHVLTLANASFRRRATTFVEIMAPCFRRDVLETLLPTLSASRSGHGWGLDDAWARLLRYEGLHVLDDVTVRHDRPVGSSRTRPQRDALRAEMRAIHRRFDARALRKSLSGTRPDGTVVPESEPEFLESYLLGYRAVAAKDPTVPRRLRRHQAESHRAWLDEAPSRARRRAARPWWAPWRRRSTTKAHGGDACACS